MIGNIDKYSFIVPSSVAHALATVIMRSESDARDGNSSVRNGSKTIAVHEASRTRSAWPFNGENYPMSERGPGTPIGSASRLHIPG